MSLALIPAAIASAHGGGDAARYRTQVLEVEPADVPVDVSITKGDQIRFENAGDEDLLICGYEGEGCIPWVRIGPDGVFEDRNSEAWHVNSEGDVRGDVPEDAGAGPADFARVRSRPAFYAYHDHRVHWMGGSSLPPGVDETDPEPQKVFDGEVTFRYGDREGVVRTRLEYVGGRSWLQRYGEYSLMGGAIVAMLVVFALDARRRRRNRPEADPAQKP